MYFKIEETFLQTIKYFYRKIGLWPEDSVLDWRNFLKAFFTFSSLIVVQIMQYIFVARSNSLKDIVEVICGTSCITVSFMKVSVIFYSKKKVIQIIDSLREAWFNEESLISIQINLKADKKMKNITRALFILGAMTGTFYALAPIAVNIQRVVHGESYLRILPFKTIWPIDVQSTSPTFEIASLYLNITSIAVVFSITCSDGLFITFCGYISAQYDTVQQDILDLLKDQGLLESQSSRKFGKNENAKILIRLTEIIKKHSKIIELNKNVSKVFGPNVVVHFLTAALNIGLISLSMIMATPFERAIYIFYMGCALSQLYIYCYGGTLVIESSRNIAKVAYNFQWYQCDVRVAKCIQMIIMRAQNGNRIDVPFFQTSAVTFINILRTAGSFITLLRTFL